MREPEKLTLRADQQRTKLEIYKNIREGKRRVCVQAMTSYGKTALSASIAHDCLEKGKKFVFTAPLITLVEQTLEEYNKFGIPTKMIGVIQANHPLKDYSLPVQIASVQSIAAIMRRDTPGFLEWCKDKIFCHDETHLLYKAHKLINESSELPIIGLSATPWRKGLGRYYDALVLGPSTRKLIDDGSLCDYVAYSHYVPNMKGVASSMGEYSAKQSGEKYDTKIVGDIVSTWKKYAEGKKTILFAPRVVDAERFADEFRQAGYKAVAVNGYMDQEECGVEIEKFKNNETLILCSVAKLATGFSVRDVECIVDAQPTQSLMRFIQKLGRGLRTHPNKDKLIILDNAGNLLRNGLPDGDYPTELDDGEAKVSDKRDKEEPMPKECPKCHVMKPPKVHECPECGFAPKKKSSVVVEGGELVEMKRPPTPIEKQGFYAELLGYARKKQYKDGFAAWKFKERFGHFPAKKNGIPPREPSRETLAYIRHLQIKKARSTAR